MPDAEITVQYLGTNKKNPTFGFIKSAEGTNYGCKAEQLKQFSTGQIYTIRYHTNQRGYAEFDAIISAPPVKKFEKAPTNQRDSERMGAHGMTNAILMGIANGRDIEYMLAIPLTQYIALLDKMTDVEFGSKLHGKQAQTRNDFDDEIPI